jgi:acyl carrier protein
MSDLAERFVRQLPETELINLYGPTEAAIDSLFYTYGSEQQQTVPIGRPIANSRLYVLSPELEPVPVGVAGELYLGGVGLARGYLHRPELTAERFVPDPFSTQPGSRLYKTGDLVRYRADGVVEYLGRLDHQVKVRGYRIEPGEIEAVMCQHPAVAEAVVQLWQSDTEPEDRRLVAYLVARAGQPLVQAELREFVAGRLPGYMVPASFVVLDQLPRLANGKLDRRALPAVRWGREELGRVYRGPRTPVEEVLAGIWAEVLGVERVGVEDNFFELGGHSLLATRVMARVREAFGLELPLRRLFETPTIAALARTIDLVQGERVSAATYRIRRVHRGEEQELLDKLDELSDQEVDSLLRKRLREK